MNAISSDLTTLQSALSYLMTRYARTGSAQVASAVIDHLLMLIEHPDICCHPGITEIYNAMLLQWRDLKEKSTGEPIFNQPIAQYH